MILETKREYIYNVNTDDINDIINRRKDDLLSYEFYVNKSPGSILYNNYYNNESPEDILGLPTYTKDELNSLIDFTHSFYRIEAKKGRRYGYSSTTGIKIKIEEVYDSTAIGSIYKSKDPNIKLRVGDIVKY